MVDLYVAPQTTFEKHAELRKTFEKRRQRARFVCKNWESLAASRNSSSIEELLEVHEKIFENPERVTFDFPPLKYMGTMKE